jgi:hypothetical protein
VAYLPQRRYGGWHITSYYEPLGMPLWSASFSRDAPAEIVSAFTNALIDCLTSDHPNPWHHGPSDQVAWPADVLARQNWRAASSAMDRSHHSLDGNAYFSQRAFDIDDNAELDGEGRAMWTMYACVNGRNGERWHADFTNRTPLYLITEAVRTFSSTAPVERLRSGIPERNLPYVTTEPVPEPYSDRRRSAALARTPHALPAVPAPAADATAPSPTPPVPFRRR